MGKSKAPTPPDPAQTAGAQTAQNIGTAIAQQYLNNTNQVTPNGSLTYDQSGSYSFTDPNTGKVYDIPRFTATQTLSPTGERLNRIGNQTSINLAQLGRDQSERLQGHLGSNFSLDGMPQGGSAVGAPTLRDSFDAGGNITTSYGTDFSRDRQRVEDALMSRLNPQLSQDKEALRTSLVNQGVVEGSEAFDRAMGRADRASTDARMQVVLAGGQEQSRLAGLERDRATFENAAQAQQFGQNQSVAGFGNATAQQNFANAQATYDMQNADRQRAIQEALLARNQPLNEISALMSGSQVQQPSYVNTNPAQLANVDRAGLEMSAYQQRLAGWQQQQAQRQSVLGGLFGLASGGLMGGYF